MAWNGSNNVGAASCRTNRARQDASSTKRSAHRSLLAGFFVIAIGSAAVWWFVGRGNSPASSQVIIHKAHSTIAEVVPAVVTNRAITTNKHKNVNDERAKLRARLKKMTPDERGEFILKRMQDRKIDLTPTTNQPFRTGIELSMARIFMTEVGELPPPPIVTMIPIQDEVHLAEILSASNPEIEGDNEYTKASKESVEMAKKELVAYIKDGGDAQSFLSYYYDKLQKAFEERRLAKKEIVRIVREEPEIAQEFYETINKKLAEKGIKTIGFTEKQKAKLGLE